MLGSFRFALALLVVVTHLSNWRWPGVYAVFGFYTISGYLMCLVLNQRYGFSPSGFRAYATNRFLRIYPPYWFACAISVALIAALGQPAAAKMFGPWQLPATPMDWFDNIVLATLPTGDENRLVPPAWALRVEIFYYAVIGLGLGRSRRLAIGWLAASVAWHVYLHATGADWSEKYYPIAAASLPFSLGALLYHTREAIPIGVRTSGGVLLAAIALWVANLSIAPLALGTVLGPLRFYTNLACVVAITAWLCGCRASSSRARSIDSRLGDLAYPIYLVHMQVGLWMTMFAGVPKPPSLALVAICLVPVLWVAWLTLVVVCDPIEKLRLRVRERFAA